MPGQSIELGRKCIGLDSRRDALRLQFAGGNSAEADVVIGADGVHSLVRCEIFGVSPATYSGICAFRALVPTGAAPDFARRPAQTLWIGPSRPATG